MERVLESPEKGILMSVRTLGPAYVQHVGIPTANLRGRAGLRSAERGDLTVPRTSTERGKWSFIVAAAVIWNSLPEHLHSFSIFEGQFRCGLKTDLFQQSYNLQPLRS